MIYFSFRLIDKWNELSSEEQQRWSLLCTVQRCFFFSPILLFYPITFIHLSFLHWRDRRGYDFWSWDFFSIKYISVHCTGQSRVVGLILSNYSSCFLRWVGSFSLFEFLILDIGTEDSVWLWVWFILDFSSGYFVLVMMYV